MINYYISPQKNIYCYKLHFDVNYNMHLPRALDDFIWSYAYVCDFSFSRKMRERKPTKNDKQTN